MNSGIKRIERFIIVVLLTFPTSAWALSAPPEKEPGTSAKDKKIAKGTSQSVAGEHASGSVLRFDLAVRGGSLLPWEASEETGNAFGCSASLVWSDFRAGVSYATALPDSRSQGLYHNVWAEFAWYFMGSIATSNVRPYVLVGMGAALADDPPEVRLGDPETIRWNEETNVLGMLAIGARYGTKRGLYVAADLRAYNLTFGGYTLSAGYTF